MSGRTVDAIERSVQRTNDWLKELARPAEIREVLSG
jgi:hypothetical protein